MGLILRDITNSLLLDIDRRLDITITRLIAYNTIVITVVTIKYYYN